MIFMYSPDWKNLERQDVVDVLTSMMNRAGSNIPGGMERIKRIENQINLNTTNDSQFMSSLGIKLYLAYN